MLKFSGNVEVVGGGFFDIRTAYRFINIMQRFSIYLSFQSPHVSTSCLLCHLFYHLRPFLS